MFEYLLETTDAAPDAIVGFSLSASPKLGDYLPDLNPEQSLDWNSRDFRGLPELREHVLAQAGLTGICTPADVLITAGAAEANFLSIMQLLQPGERIVMETPGWPQAEVLAKAKGAEIVKVARSESDGWRLPLDRLAADITPGTRIIFLTNPNNPTGDLMTAADLAEVVAIADRVGAWLLVDEVYAGLEWAGPRAPSVAGLYARGITTGSVSKALGLQGLRTGWMICPDAEHMRDALILRENSSEIMNIMGELIAEIALRPARYATALSRARLEGAANLAQMNAWIATQDLLSWLPPKAGLIGLARLPEGLGSDAFARMLLAPPYRTFLLPGSAYDLPGHIRLGVGGGAGVRLDDGLDQVALGLKDWQRTRSAIRIDGP
ncbi:pyridoxal phosphate-dependent aminotransferase [Cypionkella psychrotolerans]|uniref:pyridoxal phosphate-dependent aminotransferase n=1 Tax=Cypionkella psychrotolerans TaxID=1678131 RepID=UPI001F4045B6|nr:pyridoxal phosphate-dependent aminotransferase [Cypionkella psychrotolerans]